MPTLDRRIVVRRTVFTRDPDTGEAIEAVTDFPAWASRADASFIDAAAEGGDLSTATRTYRIRYRADLAAALVSELSIVDGMVELSADNIIEATERGERRRFLRIEATGEVTE